MIHNNLKANGFVFLRPCREVVLIGCGIEFYIIAYFIF